MVLGHEVCGRVATAGENLGVGDLVTVEPHRYCTECFYCRAGQEHLCERKAGYGVRLDGGLATAMLVPERIAYRLPQHTDPTIGALTEPIACCLHGMDVLRPNSGESLLVHGCGPAGAILIGLARLHGADPVVVLEPNARRRKLALEFGADLALDPTDPATKAALVAATGGVGFRAIIDAVGRGDLLEESVDLAARGARILVFGVAAPSDQAVVSPRMLYDKELTLLSSVINPYTHQRAVQLLDRLPLQKLTSAVFPLEQLESAFEAQRSGAIDKVFVRPNGGS